jgi:DNA-binding response OmpR family regulator
MRVLVVEDEPDLAGVLERGLGEAGFRVDVVHDGHDAIQRGATTTSPSPSPSLS